MNEAYDSHTTEALTLPKNVTFFYEELTPENEKISKYYPPALLDFAAACCITFSVVGAVGNLLSFLALTSYPRLRNATTVFIVNLCIADFIFCVLSLPFSAVIFLERGWNYGENLCRALPVIRYSSGFVSLAFVMAIAVNRYVLIVFPRQYASIYSSRNIGIMIAALWILPPTSLFLPLFEVWGKLGYDAKVGTCTMLPLNGKSPKATLHVVWLVLPSIAFIFCYSRVYWVVRKISRKIKEDCKSSIETVSKDVSAKFPYGGMLETPQMSNSCSTLGSTILSSHAKDKKRYPSASNDAGHFHHFPHLLLSRLHCDGHEEGKRLAPCQYSKLHCRVLFVLHQPSDIRRYESRISSSLSSVFLFRIYIYILIRKFECHYN